MHLVVHLAGGLLAALRQARAQAGRWTRVRDSKALRLNNLLRTWLRLKVRGCFSRMLVNTSPLQGPCRGLPHALPLTPPEALLPMQLAPRATRPLSISQATRLVLLAAGTLPQRQRDRGTPRPSPTTGELSRLPLSLSLPVRSVAAALLLAAGPAGLGLASAQAAGLQTVPCSRALAATPALPLAATAPLQRRVMVAAGKMRLPAQMLQARADACVARRCRSF
jgi:hypothetical protein